MTTSENTPKVDFGTRTGWHTHPATHPLWMDFADADCIVCGTVYVPKITPPADPFTRIPVTSYKPF